MPPELDAMTPDMPPEPSGQIIGLHDGETDHEGEMAKADLYKLATYSFKLFKKMQDDDQLESWVQAKITKAADYIASVYHYLEYEMEFSEYGKKLENGGMYSESEKTAMLNKLTEARAKIAQLKIVQADKIKGNTNMRMHDLINEAALSAKQKKIAGLEKPTNKIDAKDLADLRAKKKVKEGVLSGGHVQCTECGGSGMVYQEGMSIPAHVKSKAQRYNTQAKAMHAASKRLDKNNNGIPDDEENLDENWDDMMKSVKDRSEEEKKSKGTGKFDSKKTSTGTEYTRKSNTFTDGGDDSDTKKAKQKAKQKSSVDEAFSDKKKCPPMLHVKKMCQDGKSVSEICKMHPDCDHAELKQMVADCKKQTVKEAAKWRDAKHKDKLYTQEPRDYDQYDYYDTDYYNGPKPDDYPGEKNLKGGGEFDHNDPLQKGYGRGGTGPMNTHGKRKGMPSRDHVSRLKGSIKSAHGTHTRPNLPETAADMWKNIKEGEAFIAEKVAEKTKAPKPDFLDLNKNGNKTEPMKKAAADKKETIKESAELSRMKELMTRLNG